MLPVEAPREEVVLYLHIAKKKSKTGFIPQQHIALPVSGRGGDRRISRPGSSGFIDLSVESINTIAIRSGCRVVSSTSMP